jgi:hypothetical protein
MIHFAVYLSVANFLSVIDVINLIRIIRTRFACRSKRTILKRQFSVYFFIFRDPVNDADMKCDIFVTMTIKVCIN